MNRTTTVQKMLAKYVPFNNPNDASNFPHRRASMSRKWYQIVTCTLQCPINKMLNAGPWRLAPFPLSPDYTRSA